MSNLDMPDTSHTFDPEIEFNQLADKATKKAKDNVSELFDLRSKFKRRRETNLSKGKAYSCYSDIEIKSFEELLNRVGTNVLEYIASTDRINRKALTQIRWVQKIREHHSQHPPKSQGL